MNIRCPHRREKNNEQKGNRKMLDRGKGELGFWEEKAVIDKMFRETQTKGGEREIIGSLGSIPEWKEKRDPPREEKGSGEAV